jgi:NAD(P)-dependent dehydrogenase (short-subunit alcohol dehydrogenase family)
VVLAVRDVPKAEALAIPGEIRRLDIADLASVRAFAAAWTGDLDLLINNAGIMQVPLSRTAEGFELQFATNYLGPFALTTLLLPHLTGRVVTVSSQLHRRGRLQLDDLNWERRRYNELGAYCDSKLADLLFTIELQRRLTAAGSRVRSIAAHPGIAPTNLAGDKNRIKRLTFLLNDVERAALPTLYAATQDVPGGGYVGPDGIGGIKGWPALGKPSRKALDRNLASHLWDETVKVTGTVHKLSFSQLY